MDFQFDSFLFFFLINFQYLSVCQFVFSLNEYFLFFFVPDLVITFMQTYTHLTHKQEFNRTRTWKKEMNMKQKKRRRRIVMLIYPMHLIQFVHCIFLFLSSVHFRYSIVCVCVRVEWVFVQVCLPKQ